MHKIERNRPRGFTLIELAFVLALIGLLSAVATSDYAGMMRRGRTLEARSLLQSIDAAERAYYRDHGQYIAGAPSTESVPRGKREPFNDAASGWHELGIRPEGPVYYRYQVTLTDKGYVAQAEGDLNGDGVTSLFKLDGRTHTLTVEHELE